MTPNQIRHHTYPMLKRLNELWTDGGKLPKFNGHVFGRFDIKCAELVAADDQQGFENACHKYEAWVTRRIMHERMG